MRPGARRQAFVPVRGPACGMADPSQGVTLFGLYWQLSVRSEIAAVAVFVWEPRRIAVEIMTGPIWAPAIS